MTRIYGGGVALTLRLTQPRAEVRESFGRRAGSRGSGPVDRASLELIAMRLNPAHIVAVNDFSEETLRELIAALEVSTEFEHLIYRESELDAVWSIAGFALKDEPNAIRREALARLVDTAHLAHDLVADRRPREAADKLKSIL